MVSEDAAMEIDKRVKEEGVADETTTFETPQRSMCVTVVE